MDRKSVGQILATGSVVLSLVFVGYEVRQNTAVARMAAYHTFMDGITERNNMLATDPILAVPDEFDDVERLRIRINFAALLRHWEGLYRSVQEGILPDRTLEVVGAGRGFHNPYF